MTRTTCNHDDGPEVEVNPPLIRRPTRRHVNWHANGYKTHDNHRRRGTMMPGQEFRVCSGCQPVSLHPQFMRYSGHPISRSPTSTSIRLSLTPTAS